MQRRVDSDTKIAERENADQLVVLDDLGHMKMKGRRILAKST